MKTVYFSLAAILLQTTGLMAFSLIASTSLAAVGKPVAIVSTFLGMALLLWLGVKNAQTIGTVFLLPILFALGYIIAFYLVGVFGFHGFLNDFDLSSAGYIKSVLSVFVAVFVLYAAGAVLLYLLNKALQSKQVNTTPRGSA